MAVTIDFLNLPHRKNYGVQIGDSLTKRWALQCSDAGATAAALNLAGCTVTLGVKDQAGTAVINNRAIVPDSVASGYITMNITAADTSTWTIANGPYWYEVEIVFPVGHSVFSAGATRTFVAGSISPAEDIAN